MKLLINSDITRSLMRNTGWSDEDIEDDKERISDASKVLDKFGVYHSLTNIDSQWSICIYTQKICLGDEGMNTLFANGFDEFDIPLNLRYAALGGEGCEFCIEFTEGMMATEQDYWNQMYANACDQSAPSALWRPRLSIDGNQWCALYGENPQEGVAGFGDTPDKAMRDFDLNWNKPLNIKCG